jgi:hypothetical protein
VEAGANAEDPATNKAKTVDRIMVIYDKTIHDNTRVLSNTLSTGKIPMKMKATKSGVMWNSLLVVSLR